ncbi:C-type lectin domain family 4 member C-like [Clinocottus analis]|uniref:C-type lectin domain family 4 member C-like n=1 Tax=Clinocottus analis TaxID=304258 RepID=UPI0035C08DB4
MSNTYEEVGWRLSVKDGGQREERLVDIYDSVDASAGPPGAATSPKRPPHVKKILLRAAALLLALLCLLLAAAVIVLHRHFVSVDSRSRIRYEKLQNEYDNLRRDYCRSQGAHNQTLGNATAWKQFQSSCYYNSLEVKNWTESRKDCRTRGADLVVINRQEENDFVRNLNGGEASWIGLQSKLPGLKWKHGWEKEHEWRWEFVDESSSGYHSWRTDVKHFPENELKAFIDPEGLWGATNNGSKRWICEKEIYRG